MLRSLLRFQETIALPALLITVFGTALTPDVRAQPPAVGGEASAAGLPTQLIPDVRTQPPAAESSAAISSPDPRPQPIASEPTAPVTQPPAAPLLVTQPSGTYPSGTYPSGTYPSGTQPSVTQTELQPSVAQTTPNPTGEASPAPTPPPSAAPPSQEFQPSNPTGVPQIPSQDLPQAPTPPAAPTPTDPGPQRRIQLEELQTDFRLEIDKFTPGQFQVLFDETARFKVDDWNRFSVTGGAGYYEHPDVEPVFNVPLKFSWQRRLDPFTVEVGAGLDWFDRLPTKPNVNLKVDMPLFRGFGLSGFVDYGIWKPSAKILEEQIDIVQVGPGFYWQIDPKSYLFGSARWGNLSDGNQRFVSFGRYERKITDFLVVGANVFALSFQKDREEDYFSPPDFLSYNGEIGLEAPLMKGLRCRVAGSLGLSRERGDVDPETNVTTRCQVAVNRRTNAEFGYNFGLQNFDVKVRSRF